MRLSHLSKGGIVMNNRIVELLCQYDFKFEKNSAYGHIEGYEVNVLLNTMGIGPIFIFSTHLSQEQKSDFVAKMNARKISLVQVQPSMFGLEIVSITRHLLIS